MRLLSTLGYVLLSIGPAAAAEINRHELSDVLAGATAITELSGGALLVATSDASFVCAIDSYQEFLLSVVDGYDDAAEFYKPAAVCVSTKHFELWKKN